MATSATPTPPASPTVSVSLLGSTPLSASLQAGLAFGTALCNFLATPAGQKLLEDEMALGAQLETAVENIGTRIGTGLKRFFAKL